jgi:hypothetical protein
MRTSWLIVGGITACAVLALPIVTAAPSTPASPPTAPAPAAAAPPAGATSSPDPSSAPARSHVRYLDGDSLAELRTTDPQRYAAVHRVLTAASKVCSPGAPELQTVGDARDVSCFRSLWKTSYPPKRELRFVIEDTLYFAEITVRDLGTQVVPLGARAAPVR